MTVDGLPLRQGDQGPAVADLHTRLFRSGMLAELPDPLDTYCEATTSAVHHFQVARRMRADGVCSAGTWNALIESDYRLGDRLVYLQKPMMRGDDVEELQRTLGVMGFNAGRVDGIFGPDTQQALFDFQRNAGIIVDGIAGVETIAAIRRVRSHVGDFTVAAVREREYLRRRSVMIENCRIVIGALSGQRALADAVSRVLRQRGAVVAVIEQPDESEQAQAANAFTADLYLGIEVAMEAHCHIAYFSVPNYESAGGRALSEICGTEIERMFPTEPEPHVEGLRLPVLRETKMPAIVMRLGPPRHLVEHRASWAAAIADSIATWLADTEEA